LPKFYDSSKQMLHFLRDLNEYYKIKGVPESLKLPLAMRAVTDPIAKNWVSTVYGELKSYELFKTLFTKFLWNVPTQSRIRCSIYQDKFTRQDGEYMSSHYLKYANLAANIQPALSEEDLVGALTSHCPVIVQRSLISEDIKTTKDAINLLGKLYALEGTITGTTDRTPKPMTQIGDPIIIRGVIEQTGTSVIVCKYNIYSTRVDLTMTGNRCMVRRIDMIDEGTTILDGEQEEWRRSRRTSNNCLLMSPTAQNFEP